MLILSLIRAVIDGSTGTVVSWAVGLVGVIGLWWWTARLMVRGEVRWRALLPTAIATGVGAWLYSLAAVVWMPANVSNQFAEFGAFGIAMAFVTWFTGLAFVIVAAAALGPALVEGDDRFAQWLREGRPTPVETGAAPAMPASSVSRAFAVPSARPGPPSAGSSRPTANG